MSRYIVLLVLLPTALLDPIVELPSGKILGREATTYAKTKYYSFQNVPYAAPPVGNLRFKAPQPPPKWDGVLNATKLRVTCFQIPTKKTDSEDCLILNVYTPRLPGEEELLPVMLFIHGGAFKKGSSKLAPPDLFVDHGVVLVAINYRLGAFGFLSTQDEVIPGNNGLKDQLLAMQWTRDNIKLFGGDPEKVIIFGQSAGAASVGFQTLKQSSEGLFRGAILESGSFLCPWALQRDARSIAFGIGATLDGGTTSDSKTLLEFLSGVDASELNAAATTYAKEIGHPWDFDVSQGNTFAPVIEVKNPAAFITKKMFGLLQAKNVLKVPTIFGINSEESLLFNKNSTVLQDILTTFDDDLDLIVNDDMMITDPEEHSKMATAIRDIYTDGNTFGTNLGAFIRYSTDTSFVRPMVKHAEIYSELAPTFFYELSYDGKLGGLDVHYDGAEDVGHSEQQYYMFCSGEECAFEDVPEGDRLTSKRVIEMWTNFAKFLNPTPETSEVVEVIWPRVSMDDGDFLYLNINETLEVKNHPKKEVVEKWKELYESLGYDDFDTY